MDQLIAELSAIVKAKTLEWLAGRTVLEIASLTVVQDLMARAGRAAAEGAFVAAAARRSAGVARRVPSSS